MVSSSSASEDVRSIRLTTLFNKVIHGQKNLALARDGKLFIEALCSQGDPAICAHRLLSSPSGLSALQASVQFDCSLPFLNDHSIQLLRYFQSPVLEKISSGSILTQLLVGIVDPPFFWEALTKAFSDGLLNSNASQCFSWLLLRLICLPGNASGPYVRVATSAGILERIINSSSGETRILGQKIKHSLPLNASALGNDAEAKPGGRHDNDHADHRIISIMPTADELLSKERPFFRTADFISNPAFVSSRRTIHIDNQFRMLREDMLGELREEMSILTGTKSGRHKGMIFDGLSLEGLDMGIERNRQPWGVIMKCRTELPQLKNLDTVARKKYLKDNRNILRHGNMGCLLLDGDPVAFPTIHRDEDRLVGNPALITIQFSDDRALSQSLLRLKTAKSIQLVQLDTAVFAFEPFLRRLQEMRDLYLAEELLHWESGTDVMGPSFQPTTLIKKLHAQSGKDLKDLLDLQKSVVLDDSQMSSLTSSLLQRVSLVQGPPGTGKSFIGALIAKILHDSTQQTILVVCFTNHALDQFLEDLIDIGIPTSAMIRIGGKSTDRTKPLTMREQPSGRLDHNQWHIIDKLKQRLVDHEKKLVRAFQRYKSFSARKIQLMEYLEFLSESLPFFEAFSVPAEDDGMARVGSRGKKIGQFYLLDRWLRGADAGLFQDLVAGDASTIWQMPFESRQIAFSRWQNAILKELVDDIQNLGRSFNDDQAELNRVFGERDASIIKTKRIIACTTNGAAKYSNSIQAADPGVVLVEEAGEILEAHILTSLGPHTEQLIMIGDHKQLRPKCSYDLSVEQGDGFDLNRSLFERLVLNGFPHNTLTQQHRMRPEISSMIRHLTYPNLTDARTTLHRPDIRGFCDNIIFVNHSHPETELRDTKQLNDGKTSSKQNVFESEMILKCVRYIAQQGYGSDKLVVLTPYLGQLKLLRDKLAEKNDPILNDLDKFELIKAGLLTHVSSKGYKPSLRISTIGKFSDLIDRSQDNYQGEESDIVLISMTRSNSRHDIGFMAAPERLNVLLSRARDGLLMIGNSENFINARKGMDIWRKLFDHLKKNNHLYEGFPIKCEKHPDRTELISLPDQFDTQCPDGGCKEACKVMLKCGLHSCPSSCHLLLDHSKLKCRSILTQKCPSGHTQSWQCFAGTPLVCQKCDRERKDSAKKAQKSLEEKQRRDVKIQTHLQEVDKLEEQIEKINQAFKDARLEADQQAILTQKRRDLAAARDRVASSQNHKVDDTSKKDNDKNKSKFKFQAGNIAIQAPTEPEKAVPNLNIHHTQHQVSATGNQKNSFQNNQSPSRIEWQRLKDQENAINPAIDNIMDMIGLEEVKIQILRIKAKVETSIRQGIDLKKERLGLTLLGNPGTGKTTVARHYAKALTSLQVLSGDGFIETTGARLANEGVAGVKKHFDELLKLEGGVYFIDEAYQLAEGHNYGGKLVLDFLLAEIEKLTGKVVFIFAGYRKQMEKFFEHNPGFSSRIPYKLLFNDYTDGELLEMLQKQIKSDFNSGVDIENGADGLYMRIAIRRLGRARGREGFGNARALENLFSTIKSRQATRLTQERKIGLTPDDLRFSKEDLIGPDPSKAIAECKAWNKLQSLIGLDSVKDSVRFMIDTIKTNYERELEEKHPIDVSLNRVLLGSPGTGKTTVAKLYGQILADLGILSNGEVVVRNPSDFIGSVIGQSEANTKLILNSTVGKVLIIDEAYMLSPGSEGSQGADTYKTAVIDTIVAEVQNVPGDDRCVLLLGYEPQMITMFQNVNPGLGRRFPLSDAFRFKDFSDLELQNILYLKLQDQDLSATPKAVSTAINVLSRKRNGLNFGNGGDVENLISKAKVNYQARQSKFPEEQRSIDFIFEPQDFDLDFDRTSRADSNLQELFEGVVGCEDIIAKLDGFVKVAQGMRARNLDPRTQIPMNFIFKGPPGTGKTTTARKFGQVYYDLGFLAQVEVVECSASDLIGQYIGQTGPKTIKQLERGLGKVLFVDEAYRLAGGKFAQEAIDELVDSITKPLFAGKMIVILAGYDNDMNNLLRSNEGLSSRFADEIIFPSLTPMHCLKLLEDNMKQNQVVFNPKLEPRIYQEMLDLITEMSSLPFWGNARDIHTLAKSMVRTVYQTKIPKIGQVCLSTDTAVRCLRDMLAERCARANVIASSSRVEAEPVQLRSSSPPVPRANTNSSSVTKEMNPGSSQNFEPTKTQDNLDEGRDPGVSDIVWQQLQKDILSAATQETKVAKELKEQEILLNRTIEKEKQAEELATKLRKEEASLKEREAARIRELEAKVERERLERELLRRQQREEERKKREQAVQSKLKRMGVCPVGYQWLKQNGGYRCAGGSHWVSDSQLGTLN